MHSSCGLLCTHVGASDNVSRVTFCFIIFGAPAANTLPDMLCTCEADAATRVQKSRQLGATFTRAAIQHIYMCTVHYSYSQTVRLRQRNHKTSALMLTVCSTVKKRIARVRSCAKRHTWPRMHAHSSTRIALEGQRGPAGIPWHADQIRTTIFRLPAARFAGNYWRTYIYIL